MDLVAVQAEHVVAMWPQVAPLLGPALEYCAGEYSLDQLKTLLVCGHQSLLVSVEGEALTGAVTVATEYYPNMTVAFVTAIGGRLIANEPLFAQLKSWCLRRGHTHIRGAARPSIARLWRQRFGFEERYRIVEAKL